MRKRKIQRKLQKYIKSKHKIHIKQTKYIMENNVSNEKFKILKMYYVT